MLISFYYVSAAATMEINASVCQDKPNTSKPMYENDSRIPFSGLSENILTKEESDQVCFALECVVFPVVTIFGISGNVLSLYVLSKKTSTTSVLLIGLAIADALFLLTNMLQKSRCIIRQYDQEISTRFFVYSFSILFYTKTSISRVSTWLVVVISAERLYAVANPLKVKLAITRKKMVVAVIAVYVITFATLALLTVQYDIRTKGGTPILALNDFYKNNEEFFTFYNTYFLTILFRWIPKTAVIIFNVSICTFLLRGDAVQRVSSIPYKASPQQRDQKRITKMLVTVAAVFIVCLLPGDAFIIANAIEGEFRIYGKYHYLFVVLSDIAVLFEMVNSSVNFVIYVAVNSSFAALYQNLLCPWRKGRGRFGGSSMRLERYSSSLSLRGSTASDISIRPKWERQEPEDSVSVVSRA